MKIWLKLLIGITVGILLALFFPDKWSDFTTIEKVSTLTISFGRYTLFPLVFFSVITGIHSLIQKKKVFIHFSRTLIYMIIMGVFFINKEKTQQR